MTEIPGNPTALLLVVTSIPVYFAPGREFMPPLNDGVSIDRVRLGVS